MHRDEGAGGVAGSEAARGVGSVPFTGGHCLNCGSPLAGEYCHRCGQAEHIHRSFGAFLHDLTHSVFHFEGKFWRTLPMLALHPGELTRRYIHGERGRFLSPFAMFLFSVFLMFAVLSLLGAKAYERRTRSEVKVEAATTAPVDIDLSDAPRPLRVIDEAWRHAKANPELLAYKLSSNSYKFSWALIPISIPLVWLLFLNRRRYREQYRAYGHAVFVTYSIAFMSLFAVAYTLLKMTGLIGPLALIPFVVPPIHMYRQLRGAYSLPVPSALWRTAAMMAFAVLACILFFMLLLFGGMLG
ncbi:DUF3667 domain-containing protein [Sphingomonas sinipercae]|uniref:DUF3667 domain-containing protein n=2 Tax=Sphingomonas sinipercae TaxID=2714944 RepID=A0A6G7ZR55_9SPHN|nr:DUF3667 domain-containing protein [Sphingomonas sinipercae]